MATRRSAARALLCLIAGAALVVGELGLLAAPSGASTYTPATEAELRTAWTDPAATQIDLAASITLGCNGVAGAGVIVRNNTTPVVLNGHGFTITQTCAVGTNNGVLEQDGTGAVTLDDVTITGGRAANSASSSGGGLDAGSASVTVSGSVFSNDDVTGNGCGTSCGPDGGAIAAETLTVSGSSFSNDKADVFCGAGCGSSGGAVFAHTMTITGSTLSGNTSTTECSVFCGSDGGAVDADTSLTLTGSTVSGNTATTDCGAICGSDGGGIFAPGSTTITTSTLSGNTVTTSCGSLCGSSGAGIDAGETGLTVVDSTIANNTSDGGGGGIVAGDVTLVYATVSGNSAPNGAANVRGEALTSFASVIVAAGGGGSNCLLVAATTSHGFNLEDDAAASCGFATGTGDLAPGTTPALGALASNGGPTDTLLPQPGSPLIDAVPVASCQADGAAGVGTDQRGITRPQGAGCDTGAVEVVAVTTTLTLTAAFTG